jgi:hypothetical protein
MRLSAWTATSTSIARRLWACARSPSPITCFQRPIAASARARLVWPEASWTTLRNPVRAYAVLRPGADAEDYPDVLALDPARQGAGDVALGGPVRPVQPTLGQGSEGFQLADDELEGTGLLGGAPAQTGEARLELGLADHALRACKVVGC